MFDNNVFIDGTCHNYEEDGKVAGFTLDTNITYYRGIPLSMVSEVAVKVDGFPVPSEWIRCSVDDQDWFTLDEMTTVTEYKWEYDEPMHIRVIKEGGLAKGTHEVELTITTRTAYIPVPLRGVRACQVTID